MLKIIYRIIYMDNYYYKYKKYKEKYINLKNQLAGSKYANFIIKEYNNIGTKKEKLKIILRDKIPEFFYNTKDNKK